jgi:hypothetical protein
VICLSLLDMICSSILLVCIIRLIPAIIIMLYYCLFRIKSYGKLLIYSTKIRLEVPELLLDDLPEVPLGAPMNICMCYNIVLKAHFLHVMLVL